MTGNILRLSCSLIFVAVFALSGCAKPDFGYQQVGDKYVRFQLSPGWTLKNAGPEGSSWFNPDFGHLYISAKSDENYASELTVALTPLLTIPKDSPTFQEELGKLRTFLEPARSNLKVAKALELLEKASRTTDSESSEDLLKALEALSQVPFDNDPATVLTRLLARGVQGPLRESGTLKQTEDGLWVLESRLMMLFVWAEHTILLRASTSSTSWGGLAEELSKAVSTLELDCPPPDPSHFVARKPSPQTQAQAPSSPTPSRDNELYFLLGWGPKIAFLFFFALPAFFGAKTGYGSENPREGAARGAATAVMFSLSVLVICGAVAILAWGLMSEKGSGTVSPIAASFMVLVIGVPVGLLAAGCLAMAAAGTAYLGAAQGATKAGLYAALAAPVGLFLFGLFLYLSTLVKRPLDKHRSSFSLLMTPQPVVVLHLEHQRPQGQIRPFSNT